jgi:hypothetical protein
MTAPSTDWKETIAPGEEEAFAKIAAELAELAKERDAGGAIGRALHPKGHAGMRATLEVKSGLPAHAAQGLFATPAQYRAYVRLSNGAAHRQHDREPDLRGFALKVLGVQGKKALGDATTQDLLMIDVRKLAFRDVDEFMAIIRAGKDPKKLPQRLIGELGFFKAVGLIARVLGMVKGKRGSLVDLTYDTVAPVAFGPYAARVSLWPLHAPDASARAGADKGYLRDEAIRRAQTGTLRYELRGQFFTSEAETPIETLNVEWKSELVPLATLTIEKTSKQAELDAFIESASFDPWHALEAHRPLSGTMRARKNAYYASTQARGAAAEPDGSEWGGFA